MISFFSDGPLRESDELTLDESAVAHARAKRVTPGDAARVLDGKGTVARGTIAAIEKRRVVVRLSGVSRLPRPSALEVVVPVADRDRMLWAAEKCAELQVTAWRPAWFARSRSVSPRGEGDRFREKVELRMRSALEQSGGAWLPELHPEDELEPVLRAVNAPTRLVLDSQGTSIGDSIALSDIALAIGPEGGMETAELELAESLGWRKTALATTTLRFETAVISAVAIVRALQIGRPS